MFIGGPCWHVTYKYLRTPKYPKPPVSQLKQNSRATVPLSMKPQRVLVFCTVHYLGNPTCVSIPFSQHVFLFRRTNMFSYSGDPACLPIPENQHSSYSGEPACFNIPENQHVFLFRRTSMF